MNKSLIIDVGMHTGRDTEFYLKNGFDVIAIEANPELVKQAQSHFMDDLMIKKLILYNIAIADYVGEIGFILS